MYGDQLGEFVCGYQGVKGQYSLIFKESRGRGGGLNRGFKVSLHGLLTICTNHLGGNFVHEHKNFKIRRGGRMTRKKLYNNNDNNNNNKYFIYTAKYRSASMKKKQLV